MIRGCVQFVLAGLVASSVTGVAAERLTDSIGLGGTHLAVVTPVSKAFADCAGEAARSIPEHVWRLLTERGWQVRLAEFVVDIRPNLTHDRPRGWPANTTWANSDAVHLPGEKLLVLAEKRRNRKGEVVPANRVAGVLRHELGHAFDMAGPPPGQFRSLSGSFSQAYETDIRQMPYVAQEALSYYLQDAEAGRQEAFAEAFGIILGGGSDPTRESEFRAAFPRVLEDVRRRLYESSHETTAVSAPLSAR